MVIHRTLLAVALCATAIFSLSSPGSAQSDPEGEPREVTGTAVAQTYQDGANGTVFTLTDIETLDGESVTIRTKGGIHSDGMGQYTSHQAEFDVGNTYRMQIVESVGPAVEDVETEEAEDGAGDALPRTYSVIGGSQGLQRVSEDGTLDLNESQSTPDNFVRLPYDWNWTLPDNPPVYLINPNTGDVGNEESLVRASFDVWEDDPGSSMDWTYGGTTSVATVASDGVNAVFWADTPDPADGFLAQSTTFYNPATGQAVSTDILFNNDFQWADGTVPGRFDIVSVAIHEAGHSLGLDHAPDDTAIMFRSISSNTSKRELSLGDQGGVAAIYPPVVTAGESVSGQVTFSDGGLAPDVRLNLYTENRAQFLNVGFTDPSGNYSFDLPSSGCYVMTFIAPAGINFVTTGTGFQNRAFCADAGQAVTGIDAVLVAPGTQTTSSGQVTFTDGSPADGVKLNLYTQNRESFIGFTFTDASGDYSFNLLGGGCYVTTFIAPSGTTFAGSGGQFQNSAFCATDGEAVTGIDAQLVGAASQATFGGEVTNPDGSAQAAVRTVLYRANGDGSRGPWIGPAFTDGNGSYRFTQAAGCYVIDLIAPDGRSWSDTGSGFTRRSICVDAGETNTSLDAVLNE